MSTAKGISIASPLPKQIRFINNENQLPMKRRRISAACRTCRKRKTRCDGKKPFCDTCGDAKFCLGYGDSLESSLEGERTLSNSEIDYQAGGRGNSAETGLIEEEVESSNGVQALVKRAPSEYQAEHRRVPFFRYFGPTAIVPGFKQMVVSVREQRRSTSADAIPKRSSRASGVSQKRNSLFSSSLKSNDTLNFPLYDRDDHLPVDKLIIHMVDTFFTHLGCNFPFLRRGSFMKQVAQRSVEAILVDAVCSLAARFSDHPIFVSSYAPKSEHGNVFAQRAKAALVEHFPRPSIASTQACLLLAYESFGANQDSALWNFLGCSIRMAVDLGLQKLAGVKHQGKMDPSNDSCSVMEREEVEQERIDTIWAVFMLDRVISSGTGRPVTLRDEDFELNFPDVTNNTESGWPNPFPALIQIIQLYGRVSDLLNNIRGVKDVTSERIKGLTEMENELTRLYQSFDERLTFNATNFQHYVKSGEGTNFILTHFWFHTLIMLLHQPTLMHSFEDQILQLFPNSRELSMSSAKTIADILAFAELIDPRSFIGNPFTSQPMYIAACAFLMESVAHTTEPSSRDSSPPKAKDEPVNRKSRDLQKHSLLAAAACQNYQRCYKALQQLEKYWGGTRYILVALDQKAKGIRDPETYTEQEYASADVPNWRQKLLLAAPGPVTQTSSPNVDSIPGSPSLNSQAIGWSLTGVTNSPSSNLTFMYQNTGTGNQRGGMGYDSTIITPTTEDITHTSGLQGFTPLSSESTTTSDAEMLLGLHDSIFHPMHASCETDLFPSQGEYIGGENDGYLDMMMESQDVDMNIIGDEMMPWLEYLPQDVLNLL